MLAMSREMWKCDFENAKFLQSFSILKERITRFYYEGHLSEDDRDELLDLWETYYCKFKQDRIQ